MLRPRRCRATGATCARSGSKSPEAVLKRGPMSASTTRRRLPEFLLVTFGFSWGLLGLARLLDPERLAMPLMMLPYVVGPLIGALWVQWRLQEPARRLWGGDPFPNKWFLVAWGLGPLVALGAMFVAPLVGDGRLSFDLLALLQSKVPADQFEAARKNFEGVAAGLFVAANLAPAALYGATMGAAVALGEEIGWRVTLLRGLKSAGLSFGTSALLSGLLRGVWAVPLALAGFPYDRHPKMGALLVVGYSLLSGILATYLRVRGRSVLPTAIFVGGLNSGAVVSEMLLIGGSDVTNRPTGLAGLVVLAVLVLAIVLPRRREAALAWAEMEAD